jgi:hypothetical protein
LLAHVGEARRAYWAWVNASVVIVNVPPRSVPVTDLASMGSETDVHSAALQEHVRLFDSVPVETGWAFAIAVVVVDGVLAGWRASRKVRAMVRSRVRSMVHGKDDRRRERCRERP